MRDLEGKKIAMLVEDTYHEVSFWYTVLRLREVGAVVTLVGPEAGKEYKGWYGMPAKADAAISNMRAEDYDAIVIPGGYSPDLLRANPRVLELVRQFHDAHKVIGTICHGAWVLISAGLAKGRRLTGSGRMKDDIVNAGAEYIANDSVVDGNIVTTATWPYIAEFCEDLIKVISKQPVATPSS